MATFLNNPFRVLLTVLILAGAGPVFSQGSDSGNEDTAVAERVEDLKKKVIRLNRDLFILEEDLLFPASTRIAVFLSVDTGKFLELDAVKLKVNDEIVASHLYTERQVKALERGGRQRLYVGNLKTGRLPSGLKKGPERPPWRSGLRIARPTISPPCPSWSGSKPHRGIDGKQAVSGTPATVHGRFAVADDWYSGPG